MNITFILKKSAKKIKIKSFDWKEDSRENTEHTLKFNLRKEGR